MRVARSDAVGLTRELVRIDSRNPSLVARGPGEALVAHALAGVLDAWGFRVEVVDAAPGRPNVIARIGTPGGRTLMFNGHLDVVGVDGMIHDPWSADANGQPDRIYGRGSSDMKAGIAAMCAAAARAGERELDGEIIVAAVADEEYESVGTRSLIERGVRADGAIVTEPTRLAIMPAHLGFVWANVTTHGRAAHGSRWDIGVDAIRHAGILLAELDRIDDEELPTRRHALLGRPSVHASLINGGTGMSTYPDTCTVRIERRTIPGESPESVRRELEAACSRARARQPKFRADVEVTFAQEPSDVIGGRTDRASTPRCIRRERRDGAHRGNDGVDRCGAPQRGGNSGDLFWTGRHFAGPCCRGMGVGERDRARDEGIGPTRDRMVRRDG